MEGNRIISDTTIRTLIVKGTDEVKRIKQVNRDEHIFKVDEIAKDVYEIKLIYRVGDYMKRRWLSEKILFSIPRCRK